MDAQAIRNRFVRKMLRKNVVGSHKMQVDTIVGFRYRPTNADVVEPYFRRWWLIRSVR